MVILPLNHKSGPGLGTAGTLLPVWKSAGRQDLLCSKILCTSCLQKPMTGISSPADWCALERTCVARGSVKVAFLPADLGGGRLRGARGGPTSKVQRGGALWPDLTCRSDRASPPPTCLVGPRPPAARCAQHASCPPRSGAAATRRRGLVAGPCSRALPPPASPASRRSSPSPPGTWRHGPPYGSHPRCRGWLYCTAPRDGGDGRRAGGVFSFFLSGRLLLAACVVWRSGVGGGLPVRPVRA